MKRRHTSRHADRYGRRLACAIFRAGSIAALPDAVRTIKLDPVTLGAVLALAWEEGSRAATREHAERAS